MALSSDDQYLASAGRDGVLHLWDFPSRKIIWTDRRGVLGALIVTFSPNGQTLATAGIGRKIALHDVARLVNGDGD